MSLSIVIRETLYLLIEGGLSFFLHSYLSITDGFCSISTPET